MSHILGFDHLLRAWVVGHRVHMLDLLMWTLSAVARGGLLWLVIGTAVAWRRRRPRDLVTLALALLLASILANGLLKPRIGRERPFLRTPAVRVIGESPDDASFPSGHAASSAAAALVLSTIAPAGRVAWWLLVAAVAYSRVYLGVHYPFDVLGGALVGLVSAAAVLILSRLFRGSEGNRFF